MVSCFLCINVCCFFVWNWGRVAWLVDGALSSASVLLHQLWISLDKWWLFWMSRRRNWVLLGCCFGKPLVKARLCADDLPVFVVKQVKGEESIWEVVLSKLKPLLILIIESIQAVWHRWAHRKFSVFFLRTCCWVALIVGISQLVEKEPSVVVHCWQLFAFYFFVWDCMLAKFLFVL